MAKELGIEAHLRLLPFQKDIWGAYAAADMVIHASTKPEPFGLVILEAMLASKPVIATRGGGVTDLVVADETGILVEPGNVDELTRVLGALLDSPERRHALSRAGRDRALRIFSWEAVAAQTVSVYEQAINRHGSRPAIAGIGAASRRQEACTC